MAILKSSVLTSIGLFSLVSMMSCGTSSKGEPGIVGDWFMCANEDCDRVESAGLRFQADGILLQLAGGATRVPEGSEPVCARLGDGSGTYTFTGTTLSGEVDGNQQTFEVQLSGDRMTLTRSDQADDESREFRRLTTRIASRCEREAFTDIDITPISQPPQMVPRVRPIKPAPPQTGGATIDGHEGPREAVDAGTEVDGGVSESTQPDAGSALDAG
ncbi:MAG: hypothetical protein RJA70_4505 [Pseudomonadota bacterium]|jgi:hypothetical protein